MAKGIYGVFESTLITGRNFSFINEDTDLENGMLVHKGDMVEGYTEVYEAVIPTAASISAGEPVYVIGNPAWNYDNSSTINQNENKYFIPAGKVFRVYQLNVTDKFGISDYSIQGTPAVGEYVGLATNSGFPVASATVPANGFVGKVIEIASLGFNYWVGQDLNMQAKRVRIEVIRNA